MIAVMEGIAENGRDASVILAAVLEKLSDVVSESRILSAQEVPHIVEAERNRRQMLG